MPLPRPMATPLRTDAAGAPSFGADAPPDFRFRLFFFFLGPCARKRTSARHPETGPQAELLRMLTDSERRLGRATNQ